MMYITVSNQKERDIICMSLFSNSALTNMNVLTEATQRRCQIQTLYFVTIQVVVKCCMDFKDGDNNYSRGSYKNMPLISPYMQS